MNITQNDIFRGCLIASISHAIMTNVYPELSHEQSWDGSNYSIQNSSGLRGTITFERDYCIGAVRDEKREFMVVEDYIKKYTKNFPSHVINKAYEETFQYLLLEREGVVSPCVTSVFWADNDAIYFEERCINNIKKDFVLFENIILSKEIAIGKWKEYYGMDSSAVELIDFLYQIKSKHFFKTIELTQKQIKLIPGPYINDECVEALKELNIIF